MAFNDPTKELDTLRLACERARLPFDRETILNLAFFLGRQYVNWDPTKATITPTPADPGAPNAPRPVVNKVRHLVLEAHGKALANRPIPDALPASDEPKDVSDAQVAQAYVSWLADDAVGDYDGELSDQVLWAAATGEGFMKWTYSTEEKRPLFASVGPLELYRDPFAKRFKYCRYVVHSQFMDVQEIYDRFGVQVKPTEMSRADVERAALMRDMGYSPTVAGALVNELWLKPGVSRAHPKGRLVIWTGKDILYDTGESGYPYKHGLIPFTQVGLVPLPGTSHYTTFVTDLRKPQTELNAYHQQSLMSRKNFSSPKWWIPDELELQEMPDDSTNQVLRGNGSQGFKPEILQPESMAYSQDGVWLREEIQDVAGLHEVSRSQVPGRVEAAKAIELLKEGDDGRGAFLLKTIRIQTAIGFYMCVSLEDQFGTGERMVSTYSPEGLPQVRELKLRGINPGLRFRITMGTGLSSSRAAREDKALNMWQNGIIQDPEVMAEILDIPLGSIAPQRAFDIRLARNENFTIARGVSDVLDDHGNPTGQTTPGTPIVPNSWDAHDIHIREHNNFRKTTDYQQLDDSVKKKFEMHVQTHEWMQLLQLQKEAQKAMVAQGMAPANMTAEAGEAAASGAPSQSPEEAATQGGVDDTAAQGAAPTGQAPPEAETASPSPSIGILIP